MKVINNIYVVLCALCFVLVGCSSKVEEKTNNLTVNEQNKESTKSSTGEFEYSFKDGKVVLRDVEIKITKYKIIQVGEEGNKYGEKPVIAFWYDVTNKSNKEIDTGVAWIAAFEVIQDNDKNKVNTLKMGAHPDEKIMEDQFKIIKQGGTVTGAVAYELTDSVTPVKLVARKGLTGDEIGTQEYPVK